MSEFYRLILIVSMLIPIEVGLAASPCDSIPSPLRVLGNLPIDTARPVQLGMIRMYPEIGPRQAYTEQMSRYVAIGYANLLKHRSYSQLIEWVAEGGRAVAQSFSPNGSYGYGRYRFDLESIAPTLRDIYKDSIEDTEFGTTIFKRSKRYADEYPALLAAARKSGSRGPEPGSWILQHTIKLRDLPGQPEFKGTQVIVYERAPNDPNLLLARLIHADPKDRVAAGYAKDEDWRKLVRQQQEINLRKALALPRSRSNEAINLISENFYLELTSVFWARGSLGASVASFQASLWAIGMDFTWFKELPDFMAFREKLTDFQAAILTAEIFE